MVLRGPRVALLCLFFVFADAAHMPGINVQYESASHGAAGPSARLQFAKRASQLAASIGQADFRISQMSDLVGQALRGGGRTQTPSSFLASMLQPVDASRVRKSLAATEPMAAPAQATVNVIVAEDSGAMLDTAKYKGMLDQTAQLQEDFETDVLELSGGA